MHAATFGTTAVTLADAAKPVTRSASLRLFAVFAACYHPNDNHAPRQGCKTEFSLCTLDGMPTAGSTRPSDIQCSAAIAKHPETELSADTFQHLVSLAGLGHLLASSVCRALPLLLPQDVR